MLNFPLSNLLLFRQDSTNSANPTKNQQIVKHIRHTAMNSPFFIQMMSPTLTWSHLTCLISPSTTTELNRELTVLSYLWRYWNIFPMLLCSVRSVMRGEIVNKCRNVNSAKMKGISPNLCFIPCMKQLMFYTSYSWGSKTCKLDTRLDFIKLCFNVTKPNFLNPLKALCIFNSTKGILHFWMPHKLHQKRQ